MFLQQFRLQKQVREDVFVYIIQAVNDSSGFLVYKNKMFNINSTFKDFAIVEFAFKNLQPITICTETNI